MVLTLKRYNHDKKSTQGLLFINGVFECYTLEDEERCVKLHGETRIPIGKYEILQRKENTELTGKYQIYDWFDYHLQLQNVPGFQSIYIHIGNWAKDTEGCLLVADVAENDSDNNSSPIWKSKQAFQRLYNKVRNALNNKEIVFIVIENI